MMTSNQFVKPIDGGRPSKENPVVHKSWDEFRKTGLFLIINQLLHVFGWALVLRTDSDNHVIDVLPARVVFRGFDEVFQGEDYQKVTEYMAQEVKYLLEEAK